ncbi:MAG: hypothetical protein CW345_07235 [Firmicutes bacterium]|nr:hypothetical protein [Bacillota bacterium]MBO2521580.1 hypothetical protein [Bacillota bacterium]
MLERNEIPPALVEALMALCGSEDIPEGTVVFINRPDPRERLIQAFERGLAEGHRFFDVLGVRLASAEQILEALKNDGRVEVRQTVELDPELAPYV